ncbi:AMP-binding protein [Pantoea sp. BAV 3049]|uniref:AMP-binding protein n=1 Tax=Pantoea sp. BAV 3049 TaxID=2654188 RepID=UPI00131B879C|nr:AMP-binding protein [Pantoea sp. BAV 3049]
MKRKVQPVGRWLASGDGGIVARCGEEELSRRQWQQQIRSLGHRLLAHPGERWALCFDDSYLFSVALLAALHAGKTPVIPGHCRESLLQEQAGEFDAMLCDQLLAPGCPVWQIGGAEASQRADLSAPDLRPALSGEGIGADDVPLPAIPDEACVVLFTSGSTGQPRQIIKPVCCLDEEARWLAELWGDRLQDCTFIASVSHQHLYGLTFRIILPLALGQPFDSRQVFYSEQLSARQNGLRYAFISSPAFLRRLDLTLPAPDCQLIVSAGGPLSWQHAQGVEAWLKQPVDEIYGSTETGVLATRSRKAEEVLWQPFSQVGFSQDEPQRWRVCSPLIPEVEGLLLDDKLAFTAEGFQLCGRHDRTVKVEDKRVSLSEIERRLLALPQVKDAAALSVTRPERSGIGVVLVLDKPYSEAALARLKREWRHELHRWLEPVAMPRYWRVVDSIPQNSQSKRAWPQIQELFHAAR